MIANIHIQNSNPCLTALVASGTTGYSSSISMWLLLKCESLSLLVTSILTTVSDISEVFLPLDIDCNEGRKEERRFSLVVRG